MRAALVHSLDRIEIVERDVPRAGPGELVVAMRAVGLCGSDVTEWYVKTKAPAVLGHETAGIVHEVGAGVSSFEPGDRVFVHHHAPCGVCRSCDRGESVMCVQWKPTRLHPGGLAEYVRVEALSVGADTLKVPEGLSFADASLVEPVACGVKAVARGEVGPGDTVAVIGLGSNGILLALLARDRGATTIVGSDPDPDRRRLALTHGFDVCVEAGPGDLERACRKVSPDARGADVVLVIPTAESAVAAALAAAAPGGRVVFYSPIAPDKVWPIAPHDPYFRDLTLRFSYSCGPRETREALALIARGVVRAERLYTHRLPLGEVVKAFRLARSGGDVLKVLVEIP